MHNTETAVAAREIIRALGKIGIRLKSLDAAAELADNDPIPAPLAHVTDGDVDRLLKPLIGRPVEYVEMARDIWWRRSGDAQVARQVLRNDQAARVVAMVHAAAADIDKALAAALTAARPELAEAEDDLPRFGLPWPRITSYDMDGNHGQVLVNATADSLRSQAAAGPPEVFAAFHRWREARTRFEALVGVTKRARLIGVLDEDAAAWLLCAPLPAPPDMIERTRRADRAAAGR